MEQAGDAPVVLGSDAMTPVNGHPGRPTEETNALKRLHPVADGERHVQVVVLNPPFDGPISLELNCRKICDSCHIREFFADGVTNRYADSLHVSSEEKCHLLALATRCHLPCEH